jgi:hypothetical protein
MGSFEDTRIDNQASRNSFYFWERTSQGINPRPPLNQGIIESWVVGGERSPGGIMVESLPVEAFNIRGLPIYYDEVQGIWFVNGYPENFASAAEATAYAESLVPAEGGTTPPPPSTLPTWIAPAVGIGALIALLV